MRSAMSKPPRTVAAGDCTCDRLAAMAGTFSLVLWLAAVTSPAVTADEVVVPHWRSYEYLTYQTDAGRALLKSTI